MILVQKFNQRVPNRMCISFLFINNPDDQLCSNYKLILINNRDEYFARETQNASIINQKSDGKSIYAVDLAGAVNGTWLGISKDKTGNIKLGNLANVTGNDRTDNVTVEKHSQKRGRGPIVCDWINGDSTAEKHAQELHSNCQDFNNFNFLSAFIDASNKVECYYISNSPKSVEKLSPGFIGLGNSPMTAPFEKVRAGTEMFERVVRNSDKIPREELVDSLNIILKSEQKFFPDDELIERKKAENVDPERFSSIKISLKDLGYGTRTHTIITVDKDNNIQYIEETMRTEDPQGEWTKTHLNL